jgi:hypothetical protein
MKKIFLTTILLSLILFLSGCNSKDNPPIKKSNTDICHKEGTNFYKNTKNFTPYDSIDECLNSGGRLPKK